jgi:hypothetical protein
MPAYQTSGSITALYPGDSSTVINAEQPVSGTASKQVALSQNQGGGAAQALSVSVNFSGAPGAFEIDLETADIDQDIYYVPNPATLTTVDANNTARGEYPNIVALFARLRTKTQNANAVNCTAQITRG